MPNPQLDRLRIAQALSGERNPGVRVNVGAQDFLADALNQSRMQARMPFQTQPMTGAEILEVADQARQQTPVTAADLFPAEAQEFSGRTPLADQPPGAVPYSVPDMMSDPRMRSPAESQGSRQTGPPTMPEPFAGMEMQPENLPFPMNIFLSSIRGFRPEEDEGQTRQPSDPGVPFSAGGFSLAGEEGEGETTARGQQGREPFSMDLPMPSPGSEIISQGYPTIDQETVDTLMQRMENSAPEEFTRDDTPTSRLLAAAGQALAEAGRAPTFDQALLAIGTGATSEQAAYQQQQDELERAAQQRQNEFDRMLAETAFGAESERISSEQAARQFERQGEQMAAQRELQRARILADATSVDVNEDRTVISQPEQNEDGSWSIKTQVIDEQDTQSLLDSVSTADPEKLSSMDLVDIAGEDIKQKLATIKSPEARANIITSALIATGDLPASALPIQDPEGAVQGIEQQAMRNIVQKYGGEVSEDQQVTMADVSSSFQTASRQSDYGPEDLVEAEKYRILMDEMQRKPELRVSLWSGAGLLNNPELAAIAQDRAPDLFGGQ